jgi:catechol 2,3-dioxygenase-like lactoylglutathione lyase family enzyme
MHPRIDVITIGVADLGRARSFYVDGLRGRVAEERHDLLRLDFGAGASTLELRPADRLGTGFRGFTLSYIVDTAAAVDGVLARALRAGATIAKPPQRALWGYSAYVADPSGHLWKLASSKRKPLMARDADADETATATEIVLTIGVADFKHAKRFYVEELGWSTKKSYPKLVCLDGGEGSDLAMYGWDDLAADAGVSPEGEGARGLTLRGSGDSAEHFTDVDGFAWEIGPRPPVQAPSTER